MNQINNHVGYGYGKTILFGEHFVVYGLPAIISALNCKTEAFVEKSLFNKLIDFRPKTFTFNPMLKKEYKNIIKNILEFAGIKECLRVCLKGDLTVFSGGIGSSAACAAAIARAVNNFFNLNWGNKIINQAAFEGEKAIHGSPSGIDNTAAVFGGTFLFQKNFEDSKNFIQKMKFEQPIEIVLADSGIVSSTKSVLQEIKRLKEQNKQKFSLIFNEYSSLLLQSKNALNDFDLKKVGILMNKNHELLQKINVSCKQLDKMSDIAKEAGAFGAKLTGTGRGGLLLALTPGKNLQEKVAKKMKAAGYFVFKTSIG